MNLQDIADAMDQCPRVGSQDDSPEGGRYIQISDTLAREIAQALRRQMNDLIDNARMTSRCP